MHGRQEHVFVFDPSQTGTVRQYTTQSLMLRICFTISPQEYGYRLFTACVSFRKHPFYTFQSFRAGLRQLFLRSDSNITTFWANFTYMRQSPRSTILLPPSDSISTVSFPRSQAELPTGAFRGERLVKKADGFPWGTLHASWGDSFK